MDYIYWIVYVVLIAIIVRQRKMMNKLEHKLQNVLNTTVLIRTDNYTDDTPKEERFEYISADQIVIEGDDKEFYKSVEENREFYEGLVRDGMKLKELFAEGKTISEMYKLEGCQSAVYSSFDLANAIMGVVQDGKVQLTNGRHRCAVAKEMGAEVPVYIENKLITAVVKDII